MSVLESRTSSCPRCRPSRARDIPGVASLDILGNVIPFINDEEDKVESELRKFLGTVDGDAIVSRADDGERALQPRRRRERDTPSAHPCD